MTDSDVRVEEWAVIPGFSSYQASSLGRLRSVDRQLAGGRRCKGVVLATRLSNRGYVLVNLRDDGGQRQTRTVHTLVMAAMTTAFEPWNVQWPGEQVRHWNDVSSDNRWARGGEANCGPGKPGNLVYGTPKENAADKLRNALPPVTHRSVPRRVADYVGSLLGRWSR